MKLLPSLNTFLTVVLTARPVLAPPTRLLTSPAQPAGGAEAGPVLGGAVGEVLTRADAVTAGAEGVDRTGAVTVVTRVAGLADTFSCPGVTPGTILTIIEVTKKGERFSTFFLSLANIPQPIRPITLFCLMYFSNFQDFSKVLTEY